MSPELLKVLGDVAVALSPVVVALIGALAVFLSKKINAGVKNQLLGVALAKLNEAVFTVVKEMMQTEAEAFKAASADGKLSAEEKAMLKKVAMDKLKSYVSLEELARLFGMAGGAEAESFISSKVEAAIHDMKKEDALINGVDPSK